MIEFLYLLGKAIAAGAAIGIVLEIVVPKSHPSTWWTKDDKEGQ